MTITTHRAHIRPTSTSPPGSGSFTYEWAGAGFSGPARYNATRATNSPSRTAIVGAGVAGLSCARELLRAGQDPLILERARGVGGRCATRRVQGQPVDHGPAFLHGSDPEFLEAVRAVGPSSLIEGWPRRVHGSGVLCQPDAFSAGESRLAIADGDSAFPKRLAEGADVRLNTLVTSIEVREGGVALTAEPLGSLHLRDVVVALPAEQALRILRPLAPDSRDVAAACQLLGAMGSLPCLTLMAGYPLDVPPPEWDVAYPEDSDLLGCLLCFLSHALAPL